jgi:pimeloyl-ACP methyl ester carboxylesterase
MRNNKVKKYSILITSIVVVMYVAYCTFFYVTQRSLLFPIDFLNIPNGIAEQIPEKSKLKIENDFGNTESWYLPPFNIDSNKSYPIMIIGHGNGDLIDSWVNIISYLRENDIGVLLVEYPGYGRSEGKPNQEDITKVFIKSYDLIIAKPEVDKNKIILLGQSIGGGAICSLAKQRSSSAMILISTFTSTSIFASKYFLPKFLIKDDFDNLSVVKNYQEPILFVHGKNDKLIPITESEKLRDTSVNGELVVLNGGHNMIKSWRPFWQDVVMPFLKRNGI